METFFYQADVETFLNQADVETFFGHQGDVETFVQCPADVETFWHQSDVETFLHQLDVETFLRKCFHAPGKVASAATWKHFSQNVSTSARFAGGVGGYYY